MRSHVPASEEVIQEFHHLRHGVRAEVRVSLTRNRNFVSWTVVNKSKFRSSTCMSSAGGYLKGRET